MKVNESTHLLVSLLKYKNNLVGNSQILVDQTQFTVSNEVKLGLIYKIFNTYNNLHTD